MRFSTFPRLVLLLLAFVLWPYAAEAQPGTWRVLPDSPIATSRLDDASFISEQTGWIIDTGGYIYKTTDGGATWALLIHDKTDLGYHVAFRSVGFANEQVGWVGNLGQSSQHPNFQHILHETRDGGLSWTDITDRIAGARPAGLCGMWVVNEQVAYGVGRYGLGPGIFLKAARLGHRTT